jgi:hypothetical protein
LLIKKFPGEGDEVGLLLVQPIDLLVFGKMIVLKLLQTIKETEQLHHTLLSMKLND